MKKFELKRKKKDSLWAELTLYGQIGEDFFGDGISAASVVDALKDYGDIENLDVRINSVGGDVFEGLSIYNRLKQMKANVTVYVDGLAASIASIISMAGDEIIMGEGSLMMIHSPMTRVAGNARDFQDAIETLDRIENQMIDIYSRKVDVPRNELRTMLAKETWMNAEEAIELGFATSVAEEMPVAACAKESVAFFNKLYKNMPTESIHTSTKVVKDQIANTLKKIEGFQISRKTA